MPKLNFLFAIFRGQNQIKLNIYQYLTLICHIKLWIESTRGIFGPMLLIFSTPIACKYLNIKLKMHQIISFSFNPIPTENGLNQHIYSYHVTQSGRNRVDNIAIVFIKKWIQFTSDDHKFSIKFLSIVTSFGRSPHPHSQSKQDQKYH